MSRVMGNAPATDLPDFPEPPDEPHNHRWVAVGIVPWGAYGKAVVQSCECGKVRGVEITDKERG